MKQIPLTQGKVALVSDEDYKYLSRWKWCAVKRKNGFYAVRNSHKIDGKSKIILMHRVVAERTGLNVTNQIDHINNDGERGGLNNQRYNRHPATQKQNCENTNSKGYYWNKTVQKWQAYIRHNRKQINLGYYENEADAIEARLKAERKLFTHGIP